MCRRSVLCDKETLRTEGESQGRGKVFCVSKISVIAFHGLPGDYSAPKAIYTFRTLMLCDRHIGSSEKAGEPKEILAVHLRRL